jgi:hypothetical protein
MSNNKQQTAVDSIIAKLNNVKPAEFCSIETIKEWCQQAKEMEKEQMIEFAWYYSNERLSKGDLIDGFEQTYGGKK